MTRWPAMMKRKTAAEYADLSEAAFVREVAAGRLPPAIIFGGREQIETIFNQPLDTPETRD